MLHMAPYFLRVPALAAFVLWFGRLFAGRVPRAEHAAPPVTRQLCAGSTAWIGRPLGMLVTCERGGFGTRMLQCR